jgi:hypothetical protein
VVVGGARFARFAWFARDEGGGGVKMGVEMEVERMGERERERERERGKKEGLYSPPGHPHANWLLDSARPFYDSALIYVSSES